jgi:hypothetical protein
MNVITEAMPLGSATSRGKSSERFFQICYLSAITVSTIGWVSAFGWAAIRLASWVMA